MLPPWHRRHEDDGPGRWRRRPLRPIACAASGRSSRGGGRRTCPAPDAPFGRGGAPGRSASGDVVSGARHGAGRRTQPGRPGGPRTLTRRPATLEPSGRTLWVGAELDQPEHPPGVLRGAPPPRCLASTAARSRTQPSPLPRRAPRPGPSAGEHRDGARRRAPSARRRAATARPGADSRAAPCGPSARAAGCAAVVLERLADRGAGGSTRGRRDPPRGWSTRPEPTAATSPMRPSSSIMPSVLRGCVRAPPRAPRAGQGVRPPAAGADAVRGPRSGNGN